MYEQVKNLSQALLRAMDTQARQACFQIKQGERYQPISYRQFQKLTFQMANFFQRQGICEGQRVAIAAHNSLEWMAAYMAALLAGGVAVPLRTSLAPDTLHFILQDLEARLVILQNQEHIQIIAATLAAETEDRLPELKTILVVNEGREAPPGMASLETVLAETSLMPEEESALRAHIETISPQALAAIYYTTGELGQLRGAVFDHAQSLATMRHLAAWLTFDEDDLAFTLRPWSEVPNLLVTLHYFLAGVTNSLAVNYEELIENMRQTSPTVMLSMPTSYERYYETCMNWLAGQPEANQKVFQWALTKGKEYHAAGESASPELRQEYARADMTFFSQFRGELGGRFRRSYSTGASLPEELSEFFEAIGLPLFNIYSLTQAGGFPAVSQPEVHRLGSCGRVAPGFEIRMAEDGEILVRGELVMREYWRRPEETQQAFDAEGWLYSGDIGYLDEDGYLYITSRKQHLIVLSTGRKIAPTAIENALMATPFIAQAAIFGEGKPYVSAMLVCDLEALAAHFQQAEGQPESEPVTSTAHPKVKALLEEIICQVNSRLDRLEQIKEFSLLDQPLSRAAGELTPSMRISRHVVSERYAAQIESMYPMPPQFEESEVTQVQVDPERLRELLEKESILDAWMADAGIEFLFELARDKQIDAPSMVHICDTAAAIAQMENEEQPLSTALIVGDPVRIGRVLPASQIQLRQHDRVGRMRKILVTLAKIVDGQVLGYVIDKHGYVRGIHKLEIELGAPDNFLLGPQFQRHALISQQCDAAVFFVPRGGRQVRVFANGQLVGRYSNGDWAPESMLRIDEVVTQLAHQKNYGLALVRRILRCAFQMSEENMGAIFIVGDADAIFEHSDASEISHFASIVSAAMENLSDRELINFARQDGATVIDVRGKFRGCMVLLRPGANTQAEIGPGKGARHSSAAKMSAEANCLAITVSHDGPITMYDSGRRVLSL